MRNLRTPGVYIRDVEVKPPRRLRLDITGFVGQSERGPLNSPQPLTSLGEYRDVFGDFSGYSYLPYCVFAFFANAGAKCYVVRVAHESVRKADADLFPVQAVFKITDQALASLKTDGVPDEVLGGLEPLRNVEVPGKAEFVGRLEGAIGVEQTVRFKSTILKRAGNPIVHIEAINEGAWGNSIEVFAEGESTSDLVLTELAGEWADESAEAKFQSVAGFLDSKTAGEGKGARIKVVHPGNPSQQEQATIKSVNLQNGSVVFEAPVSKDTRFPAGSLVLGKGFRLTFRYVRNGQLVRGELFDNLSADPNHERYFVRLINGEPEERDYIKRIRAGNSILVRVTDLSLGGAKASARMAADTTDLSGGSNGDQTKVTAKYFTGYENGAFFLPPPPLGADLEALKAKEEKLFGMAAYEAVEEIGLVAIPDLAVPDFYDAVPASQIPEQGIIFAAIPKALHPKNLKKGQADMLFHCKKMGERFAILDSPRGAEIGKGENRIEEWPTNHRSLPTARYGALYYPWIRNKAADFDGRELFIPPCGHLAGVYSRSEQERGVGKAPANEPLRGAVEFEFCLSDAEQDLLNPGGINCLRIFPGRGLLVWGARTLSLDPLYRYVNIRRVALAIIKNILVNLRWTVFEPNDPKLWKKITATLKLFLNGLFESGALAGAKSEEAFFVKCDEETNPPEIVDLGQVITHIGFAPERPAEFILVTITRNPGALSVSER